MLRVNRLRIAVSLCGALALGGCEGFAGKVAVVAAKVDPTLERSCGLAMTLAPVAAPIAPWIVPACGTAEAIVRLAADPSSLEWVNGLIVKANQIRSDIRKLPMRL